LEEIAKSTGAPVERGAVEIPVVIVTSFAREALLLHLFSRLFPNLKISEQGPTVRERFLVFSFLGNVPTVQFRGVVDSSVVFGPDTGERQAPGVTGASLTNLPAFPRHVAAREAELRATSGLF
jgi:hypothetical protein